MSSATVEVGVEDLARLTELAKAGRDVGRAATPGTQQTGPQRRWNAAADDGADEAARAEFSDRRPFDVQFGALILRSLRRSGAVQQHPQLAAIARGPSDRLMRAAELYVPSSPVYNRRHFELAGQEPIGRKVRYQSGDTDNQGAELIDDCPTGAIWEGVSCESLLPSIFPPATIKGGRIVVPTLSSIPQGYAAVPAADCEGLLCVPGQDVNTTLTSAPLAKMRMKLCMPVEFTQDSFLDVLAEYSDLARRGMALSMERALVRGDKTVSPATANINNDGAAITLPAAGYGPDYTLLDGLAHATIINNTANNLTAAGRFVAGNDLLASDITAARTLMNDTGIHSHYGFCSDTTRLVILVDFGTYAKMLDMEEVSRCCANNQVSTIQSGSLPSIYGIPIMPLPTLTLTDAEGKVDAATPANNIYGQLHVVNLDGFKFGNARDLSVVTKVDDDCERIDILLSWRVGFVRRDSSLAADGSGIEAVASIYGINVA